MHPVWIINFFLNFIYFFFETEKSLFKPNKIVIIKDHFTHTYAHRQYAESRKFGNNDYKVVVVIVHVCIWSDMKLLWIKDYGYG